MAEPEGRRQVIDYESAPSPSSSPSPPRRPFERPLTVGEFGCALVSVVYGIPAVIVFVTLLIAFFSERD